MAGIVPIISTIGLLIAYIIFGQELMLKSMAIAGATVSVIGCILLIEYWRRK